MISFLAGTIITKDDKSVIINTGNVGYKVFISSKKLENFSSLNKKYQLFCYTRLAKNNIEIYGFLSTEELELFESLMSISGIGPKAALEISAFSSIENLKKAIQSEDGDALKDLFGIGKKKAQAIIFEYSRKIVSSSGKKDKDALEALIRLGFSRKEASDALKALPKNILDPEIKIREALKLLGGN